MTTRQLQTQAFTEWKGSANIKRQFHTFEYYWWEKYARVYGLSSRVTPVKSTLH